MNDSRSRRLTGSIATVHGQRYQILREIRAGGSHLIYLAEPECSPGQKVIIREFYPMQAAARRDGQGNLVFEEGLRDAYQEAFRQEQRNAIVVAEEITQAAADWAADTKTFCSVMQLFSRDSKTLYELLTDWETAPPDSDINRLYQSLNIISALLSALATLHTKGQRLHCDLSCYNVKVSGNWKDFKTGDHLSAQIFDFGSMVQMDENHRFRAAFWKELPASTPAYRACELEGCSTVLSPATDLYAVAALLYSLVCGRSCSLFLWAELDASVHQELVDNHFFLVENDLDGLEINDAVRGSLFRILKKGMALDPEERYQTAHDMQREIDRLANWIRPFQVDDLWAELYQHNRSLRDHNGMYHLGVQHEVSPGLFCRLCDPERKDAGSITSPDSAPPLYHYLTDGWNGTASFQHLILSGEGGSGKTTSLLETASRLQDEAVPVLYIPLNALTAKEHPLESYLRDVVFPDHENGVGTLRACCCQERNVPSVPQIVFLLDGVNEINEAIRGAVIGEIQTWMGYDNLQVVVAGRNDISNYQAFFKENIPHLQLMPLEQEQVERYLQQYGLLPADPDAVSVLYNPLMLVLYVNTALYQKENPKLKNKFRPELTRGAILWNYIEAQVLKSDTQNLQTKQRYEVRVAAHYAAAWVGWAMGDRYALNKEALIDLLDGFFQQYDRWKNIGELKAYGIRRWQPEPYQLVELLTDELCILTVDQGMYSFQHQMFRDYYAAVAMLHDVQLQHPEQSELWRQAPGYSWSYVCELLAEFLTEEQMRKLWDSMRGVAVAPGSYAMHKLVAVLAAKNGDDLSHIDFSEMDLRTVSLAGKRIDTFSGKARFRNAKIGPATFTDGGLPQDVNKLSVSPDGKTLAVIGESKGCLMDLATGRIVAVFPAYDMMPLDLFWAPDSSYLSFWEEEWKFHANIDQLWCYYKTVDLAGNTNGRVIGTEGSVVAVRCGEKPGSMLQLLYDSDREVLYLKDYSLRIEMGPEECHCMAHSWSKDGRYLFLAWEKNGSYEEWLAQRYRFLCFDLDRDQIAAQIDHSMECEVVSISSAPDGSCLLIEAGNYHEYYLLDVQKEQVIGIDCGQEPIWTADGKFLVWCDPGCDVDEILLFQLDSRTVQKIQLNERDNWEIWGIGSFMRGKRCYLIWYGYETNMDDTGLLSEKSIFFEIYSIEEKECVPICVFPSAKPNQLYWTIDECGTYLSLCCRNGTIFCIDVQSRCCKNVEVSDGAKRAYSPNEKYFVREVEPQDEDLKINLYRMNDQQVMLQMDDMDQHGFYEQYWSPAGTYVAQIAPKGEMTIRDLKNRIIWSDDDCCSPPIVWSPDERYLLYTKEKECKIYQCDLEQKTTRIMNLSIQVDWCEGMAWAYQKNLLACSHRNELYLFYLGEKSVPKIMFSSAKPFYQCESPICQVLFSPDEAYLAVSDEGGCLYLWNLDEIPQGRRPRVINNLPLYLKFRPVPGMNLVNADFTGAAFSNEETRELIRRNGGNVDGSTILHASGQALPPVEPEP